MKTKTQKITSVNFVPPLINPWSYDPQVVRDTVAADDRQVREGRRAGGRRALPPARRHPRGVEPARPSPRSRPSWTARPPTRTPTPPTWPTSARSADRPRRGLPAVCAIPRFAIPFGILPIVRDHPTAQARPRLSVVVPIYNVEDYLGACLESIADQTFARPRGRARRRRVARHAPASSPRTSPAAREGWKVLHVENGGLGRARNIGLDAATADYVTFVDSDDVVPRDAYELMMHAIEGSGSDIVSGGVLRYDGARTRPSGLHRRAVPETRVATHVRAMPSLLYDTTAWNKIFRREFLLEHGLRFPEGVYYEDIPLTVPAHFLARSVDLIQEPVYLWRERQTAEQSITQRRAESRNLVDRMAAVSSVNDFLESTGEVEGKRLHDLKVLTLDMPLFLDVLHEGDAEFAQTLVRVFRDYLSDVDPDVVASLPPRRRLAYFLIEQGRTEELVQAHQLQLRDPRPPVVRRGVRLYVQLPFFGDESVGVPDAVYDVTRSQRLVTGIRDVRWNRTTLEVDGHAFIDGVPDLGPRHDPAPAAAAARGGQGRAPHRAGAPHPPHRRHRPLAAAGGQLRRLGLPGPHPRHRHRAARGQGRRRVRARRPGRRARRPPWVAGRQPRVLPCAAPAAGLGARWGARRARLPRQEDAHRRPAGRGGRARRRGRGRGGAGQPALDAGPPAARPLRAPAAARRLRGRHRARRAPRRRGRGADRRRAPRRHLALARRAPVAALGRRGHRRRPRGCRRARRRARHHRVGLRAGGPAHPDGQGPLRRAARRRPRARPRPGPPARPAGAAARARRHRCGARRRPAAPRAGRLRLHPRRARAARGHRGPRPRPARADLAGRPARGAGRGHRRRVARLRAGHRRPGPALAALAAPRPLDRRGGRAGRARPRARGARLGHGRGPPRRPRW